MGRRTSTDGRWVADWAEKIGLGSYTPEGPMYDRGNTIDLVFSNVGVGVSTPAGLRTGLDYVT